MQGKLIVFEGGEGAGKTTQMRQLAHWLNAHPSFQQLKTQTVISELVVTREPGGTSLGSEIRRLLLEYEPAQPEAAISSRAELLLYAADRAQHVDQCLRPYLEQGAIILCDRYTASTVAYQGYGRSLDLPLIHQLNQIATGGLQSDLTIWLDLDISVGLTRTQKRGQADRMEKNDHRFHERVRQGFQVLHQANPERMVKIDAEASQPDVAQKIQQVVDEQLSQWYAASGWVTLSKP